MITIADTLLAEDVALNLEVATPAASIDHVAKLLMDDERVLDWKEFYSALKTQPPCKISENGDFAICIPHARTQAVGEMVMSVARLARELPFPGCEKPVRYIFCIGVPQALASDYLRIAGSLMRIFKDPNAEKELHAATTPAEFIAVLSRVEKKL